MEANVLPRLKAQGLLHCACLTNPCREMTEIQVTNLQGGLHDHIAVRWADNRKV